MQKNFLHHFVDDTLDVIGPTSDKTYRVYDELTEDDIDQQYGMLSPLLCCFDRCVHHDVNVQHPVSLSTYFVISACCK